MNDDFILKNDFTIYNNQATSGNSKGRLSIKYDFHPAPAIFWEFESYDADNPIPEHNHGNLTNPFQGYQMIVPKPRFGKPTIDPVSQNSMGTLTNGSAPKVVLGDQNLRSKSFSFFLPNAKFLEICSQTRTYAKEIYFHKHGAEPEFSGMWIESLLEANVDNFFRLELHTPVEALDWLESYRSTGIFITTSGRIETGNELSISEAVKLLEDITYLLSFANGGFIGPLIVRMETTQETEKSSPSEYSAYIVDSIERIGATWVSGESDITPLFNCVPSFQKMLQTQQWKKSFSLVLKWYFQAIQPQGIQVDEKIWPIVANALGAALEKLSSIILVEEMQIITEEDFSGNGKKGKEKKMGMSLENKIRNLLETIGIHDTGPNMAGHDAIWWFKEMRNDATHPKSNHEWKRVEVDVILGNAIQWVEETLLWRIGYQGTYKDRSRGDRFTIKPRYKLEARDASW